MTDIEKLRELLAAATPGPWKHIPGKRMVFVVAPECHVYSNRDNDDGEGPYHPNTIKRWNADAALICAAVNALPELIAVKAERDKAQRACEQMGARITELLALREERADIVGRDLEFARMADGTIKVGYNPRTEEGGWTLIGDVTKAVTAIEAQRDNALRDLDAANQLVIRVRAALNRETGQ